MRLIRNCLAVIAPLIAVLALVGASAVSASASAAPVPVTRILIYDGSSSVPLGPPGPLTGGWTVWPDPAQITTTNDGTLVEDASLTGCAAGTPCGKWWFSKSSAILHSLYWDQPDGDRAQLTNGNFSSPLNQNSAWLCSPSMCTTGEVPDPALASGVISPDCMVWVASDGQHWIKLDTTTLKWSAAKGNCAAA